MHLTLKKRTIPIALLVFLIATAASAREYGSYDPKRILIAAETPTGKQYSLDLVYLDRMLNDLSLHAKNYPPQFDTLQDRQRATRDVQILSGMLDSTLNGPTVNSALLLRAAIVNSVGHNLDIAGAGEKAISTFQKLLAAAPADPRANYLYGAFLTGIAKPNEAIPYLEKALAAGVADAAYSLGLTYLTLGEKEKALEYLEIYKRRNPDDENTEKFLDAIRSGKVEFKRAPERK